MDSKKKPKIGRGLTTKPRAGWKRITKYTSLIPISAAQPQPQPQVAAKIESQRMHLRRCHLCDTVTEQHGEHVTKCDGCGKSMAPFYFFNDEQVVIFTDHDTRPESPELTRLSKERLPIRGLTAFW